MTSRSFLGPGLQRVNLPPIPEQGLTDFGAMPVEQALDPLRVQSGVPCDAFDGPEVPPRIA